MHSWCAAWLSCSKITCRFSRYYVCFYSFRYKLLTDLVVYVELVGMTSLHHQAQQICITVDLYTLQLPSLVACTLIAVKAEVSQALHDTLFWIC